MRKSGRSFTVSGSRFPTKNLNVEYPEDVPDTVETISFNDLLEWLPEADLEEVRILRKILSVIQLLKEGRPLSSIEVKIVNGKRYYYRVYFDPVAKKKVYQYLNNQIRPELLVALNKYCDENS